MTHDDSGRGPWAHGGSTRRGRDDNASGNAYGGGVKPGTLEGLRRALDVGSEGVPTPDGLAATTWMRGRRVRRRRVAMSSGAVTAALAATVLGWALISPGGAPGPRDAIPAGTTVPTMTAPTDGETRRTGGVTGPDIGTSERTGGTDTTDPVLRADPTLTEEAPEPTQDDPAIVPVDASAETERVWAVLRSGCLEDRGYEVWVNGSSLSASKHGARAGDYTRDTALCDAELAMSLPPVDVVPGEDGEVPQGAVQALTQVYREYVATAACVRREGLPVDEAPTEEEFVTLFAREWMPSWHPWTAAVAEGRYAEVRATCPVG